jgi:hypothetical protein
MEHDGFHILSLVWVAEIAELNPMLPVIDSSFSAWLYEECHICNGGDDHDTVGKAAYA